MAIGINKTSLKFPTPNPQPGTSNMILDKPLAFLKRDFLIAISYRMKFILGVSV